MSKQRVLPSSGTFTRRPLLLAPLLAAGALLLHPPDTAQAQNWQTPYAAGSAADLTLQFSNGVPGNARSPDIPFIGVLNVNTTTPGFGSGGGWDLTAIGAATIGTTFLPLGETHAQVQAGSGSMAFQMDSDGVAELLALSLGNQWEGTASIAGSDSWVVPSQSFRYSFDLLLSNDVITLSPSLFSGLLLTIEAGSDVLFQGSLNTILPALVPVALDVGVEFTYDPTLGPLQITWDGSGLINTQLLSLLGDGTSTIFQVSNGAIEVDAIPEPSAYALLVGSAGLLAFIRRRPRR